MYSLKVGKYSFPIFYLGLILLVVLVGTGVFLFTPKKENNIIKTHNIISTVPKTTGVKKNIPELSEQEDDINAFKQALLSLSGASNTENNLDTNIQKNENSPTGHDKELSLRENDNYSKQIKTANHILESKNQSFHDDANMAEIRLQLRNDILETKNDADKYLSIARNIYQEKQTLLSKYQKQLNSVTLEKSDYEKRYNQSINKQLKILTPIIEESLKNVHLLILFSDYYNTNNGEYYDNGILNHDLATKLATNYSITNNLYIALKNKQIQYPISIQNINNYVLKTTASLYITLKNTLMLLQTTLPNVDFRESAIESNIAKIQKNLSDIDEQKQKFVLYSENYTTQNLNFEIKILDLNNKITPISNEVNTISSNIEIMKHQAIKTLESLTRKYMELENQAD